MSENEFWVCVLCAAAVGVLLFALGTVSGGHQRNYELIDHCEKFGAFTVSDTVYECNER